MISLVSYRRLFFVKTGRPIVVFFTISHICSRLKEAGYSDCIVFEFKVLVEIFAQKVFLQNVF